MEILAAFFIAKPFNILAIALVFIVAYLYLLNSSFGAGKSTMPVLIASLAWGSYAAWEWLVMVKTPEADIRADLLLIWPAVALLSLWAIYKFFR